MDSSPKITILSDGGKIVESSNYTTYYDKDGKIHREGGPAEFANGNKKYQLWYWHGRSHRTDGPATIFSNGRKRYAYMGV